MPYYCTVPRCTSMAGKAANVSFHQFPRDAGLAERWNYILKRGKPYTKYSKVCSLHFTPADYTMTSVGKNKGHWRTLRKDAVPSRNLPGDNPVPYRSRAPRNDAENISEQQMQQQLAHAVYVQTMLAVHAANMAAARSSASSVPEASPDDSDSGHHETTDPDTTDTECNRAEPLRKDNWNASESVAEFDSKLKKALTMTFKCELCSKCFKDPDVYLLHKRWHSNHEEVKPSRPLTDSSGANTQFDPLNLEHHLLIAMRMNMESYLNNIANTSNVMESHSDDDGSRSERGAADSGEANDD